MLKITCSTVRDNKLEFTFQLMTVDLLKTAGFRNLKYQVQAIFATSKTEMHNQHPYGHMWPSIQFYAAMNI